jgi:protein involved in polysaccharide export with SLBB domain
MPRVIIVLPVVLGLTGCLSWKAGTIAPGELSPDLQAAAPLTVTPLQLANLGGPVHSRYVIRPGDLLDVSVSNLVGESPAYPMPTRVLDDGTVRLPLVGPVSLCDLTLPQAEQCVFAAYSSQGVLNKPQVVVALRETRKVRVHVLGAVKNPGQYELGGDGSDVLSALVASGGLTADASSVLEIRRRIVTDTAPRPDSRPGLIAGSEPAPAPSGGFSGLPASGEGPAAAGKAPPPSDPGWRPPEPLPLALAGLSNPSPYAPIGRPPANSPGATGSASRYGLAYPPPALAGEAQAPPRTGEPERSSLIHLDLTQEHDKRALAQGLALQNGDVISIEPRKIRPIYVVGMVNKPGEYPLPPDRAVRVLEAIGLAGGVDRTSLPDKAVVIRQRPDQSGVVTIRIDLNRAKRDIEANILLTQGDMVSVEETAASYTRGLIRGAFRLGVGASFAPTYGY